MFTMTDPFFAFLIVCFCLVELQMSCVAVVELRLIERKDLEELQLLANDRDVWLNLRNVFPHPYTAADAEEWLKICSSQTAPHHNLGIYVDGVYAGGISAMG